MLLSLHQPNRPTNQSRDPVAEYLGTVWLGHILTELLLLVCLIRGGAFRRRPYFAWFIAFDVARATALFPLWKRATWTAYGYSFLITEPVDMLLLACAGIEAFGMFVQERVPFKACVALIVPVLLVGAVIPYQYLQSRPAPTWQEVLLNKMFLERALVTALPVALLWWWSWFHEREPDTDSIVLIVFCLFDLITYFSMALFPAWVKSNPFYGPLFVMSGQTACLMAWTIRAAIR